jgi:hypothetical protein
MQACLDKDNTNGNTQHGHIKHMSQPISMTATQTMQAKTCDTQKFAELSLSATLVPTLAKNPTNNHQNGMIRKFIKPHW